MVTASGIYGEGKPKDVRGKRAPATVADVDLDAIKKSMAATIEKAKANWEWKP